MKPVSIIPKNIITAPTGVTKVETPSQKTRPSLPDLPRPARDKKIRLEPTITLGSESGILIFDRRNAKDRKTKGRNIVAKPKTSVIKSLKRTRIKPLRENEIIIRKAIAKKKT